MLSKTKQQEPIVRDFFNELKDITWKPITYYMYNVLDDGGFTEYLQNTYKERFSIDDFEYGVFAVSEKEKFLIQMHNSEYLKNVNALAKQLASNDRVKINIDYKKGEIQVIKLLNVKF